jgi:hypothetical protein
LYVADIEPRLSDATVEDAEPRAATDAWTWHDSHEQYPDANKPDGNYTGLAPFKYLARTWPTEREAAASARRAHAAGVSRTAVVPAPWATARQSEESL